MQNKTTWDTTLHRSEWLATINQQTTSAGEDVEKGNSFALSVGMQTGVATVESSMEILQKIKIGSAFWPINPTSENISKGTQNTNSKEHKHLYIHCNIIYNHWNMEAAQVPISRWVDKKAVVHLHNRILLDSEKEGTLTFCDSMDQPADYYAEWNKRVRER